MDIKVKDLTYTELKAELKAENIRTKDFCRFIDYSLSTIYTTWQRAKKAPKIIAIAIAYIKLHKEHEQLKKFLQPTRETNNGGDSVSIKGRVAKTKSK